MKTDRQPEYQEGSEDIPFSAIIGLANEAIVVVDEAQKIILINQGAERIFGYTASEVAGSPLDIFLPAESVEIHRAHVERFSSVNEPARYMHQRREVFARRKNGEVFPVEASIVKAGDGSRSVFVAILRDVTGRQEAERQQATFSHAIEQAGDVVFITDNKGLIEYVNPAFEEATGYAKNEVLGQTPRILKSGEMPAAYYQQVWETILSGGVVRAEVLDRKKNGELFYYDQTISPLKDLHGNISHFVSTGKDVTLRKRTEQEVDLLLKLTLAIAEAESFDDALSVTLKLVCETTHWDFGEVWLPAYDGTRLELGEPYYSKFENVQPFLEASRKFTFTPGIGLPGIAWQSAQTIWIPDVTLDASFPRAAYAREVGLKTAVAIPVMVKNTVVAILEFFMREEREKDERMMTLSATITAQLSSVFQRKQADEALKQSEARLREAQRIAKMGNWELDLITHQLRWSDEIFRIFEIDSAKFGASYQAFLALIHPEDREAVDRAYTQSLQSRCPYEITHRLLMPDKRVKYVEEHGEHFYASDGSPIRSVGTVQDITERKQIEDTLRESEDRYRLIFDNSMDAILLTILDGSILSANPAACAMFQRTEEEIIRIGRSGLVDAADPRLTSLLNERARTGKATGELTLIRKDGSTFPVEISSSVFRDNNGRLNTSMLIRDITERKQAEESLRASEEKYRVIIQTAMDGYWLTDPQGRLLDVNDGYCQMSGYDRQELLNMHISDLEALEDPGTTAAHIHQVISFGEDRFESMHRRKDGSSFNVEISVQYKPVDGGRFVAFLRDITERKHAEQQIKQSEEKWRRLFSILPVGVSILDAGWNITDTNPALLRILDMTEEDLAARQYQKRAYFHPDETPMKFDEFPSARALLENHEVRNVEIGIAKTEKDSSVIWTDVSAAPLPDGSCVIVITDITERKLAEEALRISEEKYRTVADFTYDWEAWRGPDGNYVYISPSCKRITGHSAEEFVADPDLVVKITHPNDRAKVHMHRNEIISQTARTALQSEFRIILPNGETRWLTHTCVPVYGKNGDFLGRRENNRDITERKIAEMNLRDSEQRLREIVDAAPFGAHVYQVDENGHLIFMDANESANEILGTDNSAFVGKTFEEAFPHLESTELPEMYRRVAEDGIRYNVPRFNYHMGKKSAIFEIHAIQIAPGRIASFFRNISEIAAAYDETIVGWSRAMDLRDKETEEHTERVTYMAVEMARMLGFRESELVYVRWGALLHDIGKIGIPDSILLKPANLNEEERALMRRHPIFAYEMLVSIRFLRPALDIPYCHHEKWDGSGYPRGLKGEAIPLSARIFALIDVWDALRSDRPYRQKWSKKKTIEHIRSLAGSHFDPALVDVFLDFISKKKY